MTICSDGCAAQFDRFTLSILCFSELDWGVEINWSFCASGHGKGVVDGIRAIAKRTLWSAIMTRKAVIKNSKDCYEYLVLKGISGMHIFFVSSDDIKEHQLNLDKRWKSIKTIPHIQKHHHFQADENKCIIYTLTASSSEYKKVAIIEEEKLNYSEVYNSSDSE